MAFSQLSAHEKDAFFSLLDEFRNPYFASRPDLLGNIAKSQGAKSAANAAHSAFNNPAIRNSAIDTQSGKLAQSRLVHHQAEEKAHNGPGRVAAAAASFMSSPRFGGSPTPTSTGPPNPPPPPTRKPSTKSTASDSGSPSLPANKPPLVQRRESTTGPLSTTRTFGGDVDVTSAKGFFTSIKNSKNPSQPLATPSSFLPPTSSGTQKKQFAPPPVRRVTSDSSPAASTTLIPTPPAPPPPPPRKKEEPAGEWAEVLYDFTGDQPEDLDVEESQRVLIVERSSEDWWTAELNGKRGTVPASYVKLL